MDDFLKMLLETPLAVLSLFFFLRLMGNKEMRQSTPMEFGYVVLMVSIAWDLLLEPQYSFPHMLLMMSVLSLTFYLIDWITYKSAFLEALFMGEPKEIIRAGKVNEEVLKQERMSRRELEYKLRSKGFFELENIEIAYLEVDGEITVKRKESR